MSASFRDFELVGRKIVKPSHANDRKDFDIM